MLTASSYYGNCTSSYYLHLLLAAPAARCTPCYQLPLLLAAGYVGIALVLSANVLRRLPWSALAATRKLLTPLEQTRRVATTSDTRCEPLLPKSDTCSAPEERGGQGGAGGGRVKQQDLGISCAGCVTVKKLSK